MGGRECPICSRMIWLIFTTLAMTKRASSSASAPDAAKNLRKDVGEWIGSFNLMGCLFWGNQAMKNCSEAWFFTLGAPRHKKSEWLLSTISDFQYLIFALGT